MAGELLLHTGMLHDRRSTRAMLVTVVLVLIALLAVAAPTLWLLRGGRSHGYRDIIMLPQRVVPREELPPVEPMKLVDLSRDDARRYNAAQPFSTDPIVAAQPFRFAGGAEDRARATDCLAAAAIYEAGDDTTGERAVAQVVLNRLRHPAYPKTVCGVVFQGAERITGCQFTFTCDGALTRWKPSEAGWRRAREVAGAALAGAVDPTIGYATHYHTDWVVPYWQASLDKIAAVRTHLFFRWSGWWGTPRAFDRQPLAVEPPIDKLATLSPAHAGAGAADGVALPGVPFFGRTLKPLVNDPDTFLTALDPAQPPASYKAVALQACGERPHCKVLGWTDVSAMAFTTPLPPESQAALSFSYLRDRGTGFDKALWNCAEFKHAPAGACMKRVVVRAAAVDDAAPLVAGQAPDELSGVRRRSAAIPTRSPSPFPPPPAAPFPLPVGEGGRRVAPDG